MPIYPYECPSCGRRQDQFARIDDRDANAPACCGQPMARQLAAPMVAAMSVREFTGYRCPMTGEEVKSERKRKYLMEQQGVVDARDYETAWARKRAKDRQDQADLKAYMDSLPEAVKKAATETAPPPA